MSEVRVPFVTSEPLVEGVPAIRVPLVTSEPLVEGDPKILTSCVVNEPLMEGIPNVRIAFVVIEALVPVPEDLPVSTTPFPGFGNSASDPSVPQALDPFDSSLPGLTFSVHKKPMFKTNISEAPSGKEIRNALAEFPRWDFSLPYEFLEDRTGSESSLKTIMGFFLTCRGSFQSWLFKDPDDYLVVNGVCGESDGLTTIFPLCRTIGDFREKIGQVDVANTVTLYLTSEETRAIPGSGPFTITVTHAATFVEDLGVVKGGVPLTKAAGAPAASQYAVNLGTGVYTFNATDNGDSVVITYRYTLDPLDYTVTEPNQVIFDTAPAVGTISASFQFFFACRFLEDEMDFEKFMDKLWSLQECNFRSIIQ